MLSYLYGTRCLPVKIFAWTSGIGAQILAYVFFFALPPTLARMLPPPPPPPRQPQPVQARIRFPKQNTASAPNNGKADAIANGACHDPVASRDTPNGNGPSADPSTVSELATVCILPRLVRPNSDAKTVLRTLLVKDPETPMSSATTKARPSFCPISGTIANPALCRINPTIITSLHDVLSMSHPENSRPATETTARTGYIV